MQYRAFIQAHLCFTASGFHFLLWHYGIIAKLLLSLQQKLDINNYGYRTSKYKPWQILPSRRGGRITWRKWTNPIKVVALSRPWSETLQKQTDASISFQRLWPAKTMGCWIKTHFQLLFCVYSSFPGFLRVYACALWGFAANGGLLRATPTA